MAHARVEVLPLRWPLAPTGAAARLPAAERRGALFVVRLFADGPMGLGEASPLPGGAAQLAASGEVAAELARALEGRAWTDASAADCAACAARVAAPWPALRFGVETALLGALAQRRGVALAELFGPAAARVPINAVVDSVAQARAAAARGVRAFKIKLGADLEAGARLARELRAALPDARLRGDANRAWHASQVRDGLRALAPAGLDYVEEPCADTAALLTEGDWATPLALDESLAELTDDALDACLRAPALAALVLKPTVVGGLARALALGARAAAHGKVAVTTHALEGPVGTAACAELARALAATQPTIPVGLDAHSALTAWPARPPQLADDAVVAANDAGLGLEARLPQLRSCAAVREPA